MNQAYKVHRANQEEMVYKVYQAILAKKEIKVIQVPLDYLAFTDPKDQLDRQD